MSETETAPEAETTGSETHRDERLSHEFVDSVVTLLEKVPGSCATATTSS